jgi:two-component system LytT family sensor kinase
MPFLSYHLFHGLLTFSVLYTTALLIESERVARGRELREVQLQEQVSRAQLHTLRMQLQPHFLFNTLNSISALVEQDVRGAQRMLSRLSDFLRMTLTTASHQDVPLREELRLLDTYVDVERVRFGDRLRVAYDVAPEAEEALVPNLILQPLVENAIRHGIQPAIDGGTVTIRAYREDSQLVLEVTDDGVGFDTAAERADRTGVGLANTRERLRQRYGTRAELEIVRRAPSGTAVIQRLPFISAGESR